MAKTRECRATGLLFPPSLPLVTELLRRANPVLELGVQLGVSKIHKISAFKMLSLVGER